MHKAFAILLSAALFGCNAGNQFGTHLSTERSMLNGPVDNSLNLNGTDASNRNPLDLRIALEPGAFKDLFGNNKKEVPGTAENLGKVKDKAEASKGAADKPISKEPVLPKVAACLEAVAKSCTIVSANE